MTETSVPTTTKDARVRAIVALTLTGALGCTQLVGGGNATDARVTDVAANDLAAADVAGSDAGPSDTSSDDAGGCGGNAPVRAVSESAHLGGTLRFSGSVLDAQGRTWLYGAWNDCAHKGSHGDACVVRLTPDGRRDATFGANGRFCDGEHEGPPGASVELVGATLTRDGHFVGVGFVDNVPPLTQGYIVRLNGDSTIDTAFGDNGTVHLSVRGPSGHPMRTVFNGVMEDEDGSLVLVGSNEFPYLPSSIGILWRLRADGSPDPTFHGGEPVFDTGAMVYWGVARVGDGYAVGGASIGQYYPRVVRYTRDGERVSSFGTSGAAVGNARISPRAFAVDRRGGYIIAGASEDANTFRDVTAQRFTEDGRLDLGYGNDGLYRHPSLLTFAGEHRHVCALDCDDRLHIFAYDLVTVDGVEKFRAWWLRLRPDGHLDPGFGDGGVALAAPTSAPVAMTLDTANHRMRGTTLGGVYGDVLIDTFQLSP